MSTREVGRWLTWARVVTGWDSAPWRPNVACPMCEHVGGLRVRLEDRAAACLDCGEAWSPDTIGLLADHLRSINADHATRQQRSRLLAELDGYFPYRGPCLVCGVPGEDARHRVIDSVVGRVLAGDPDAQVAEDFGLSVEAVRVAVAVATWPVDDLEAQQATA